MRYVPYAVAHDVCGWCNIILQALHILSLYAVWRCFWVTCLLKSLLTYAWHNWTPLHWTNHVTAVCFRWWRHGIVSLRWWWDPGLPDRGPKRNTCSASLPVHKGKFQAAYEQKWSKMFWVVWFCIERDAQHFAWATIEGPVRCGINTTNFYSFWKVLFTICIHITFLLWQHDK